MLIDSLRAYSDSYVAVIKVAVVVVDFVLNLQFKPVPASLLPHTTSRGGLDPDLLLLATHRHTDDKRVGLGYLGPSSPQPPLLSCPAWCFFLCRVVGVMPIIIILEIWRRSSAVRDENAIEHVTRRVTACPRATQATWLESWPRSTGDQPDGLDIDWKRSKGEGKGKKRGSGETKESNFTSPISLDIPLNCVCLTVARVHRLLSYAKCNTSTR